MAFFLSSAALSVVNSFIDGGKLSSIGGSGGFAFATGALGAVGTVVGWITQIAEAADPGPDPVDLLQELETTILNGFDDMQSAIDDLGAQLSAEIADAVGGARLQSLAGALSRSLSARDLLYSYDASPDDVTRSEIISDASRGLRDTLAQATAIATSTDSYEPTLAQVSAAVSSVAVALAVRGEVALLLERNEIGSEKIQRQFSDSAAFFENATGFYRGAMTGTYTWIPNPDIFDPESGQFVVNPGGTLTVTLNTGDLDLDDYYNQLIVEEGDTGYSQPYKLELNFQGRFANWDDLGITQEVRDALNLSPLGVWVDRRDINNDSGQDQWSQVARAFEYMLENVVLRDIALGDNGENLLDLATLYRSLSDGVEKVLRPQVGASDDGTLVGSEGNDLLVGVGGDDSLSGLGDADVIRAGGGRDTLEGGEGEDRLYGEDGDDLLLGDGGDDWLEGGEGNDTLNGGDGRDVARFFGDRSSYVLGFEVDGSSVEIHVGRDGEADVLQDVERLYFDDATVNIYQASALSGSIDGDFVKAGVVDGQEGQTARISHDFIVGHDGSDTISGGGGSDTLLGGESFDLLDGGEGDDYLDGQGGNSSLLGGAGNDTLVASNDGIHWMTGGTGDDLLDFRATPSFGLADLSGLKQAYRFEATDTGVLVIGPDGHDLILGSARLSFVDGDTETVDGTFVLEAGTSGDDDLGTGVPTSTIAEILAGFSGDDTIRAGGGDDILLGGSGNDRLRGENGDDSLEGDAGDDRLTGGDGNDTVDGGDGRDLAWLGTGDDLFLDTAQADFGDDTVNGGRGNDQIGAVQGGQAGGNDDFRGHYGSDTLAGGDGDDRLDGGAQYDKIYSGTGDDTAIGGKGRDLVYLGEGNDVAHDTVQLGLHGADRVYGGHGADTLHSAGGDDTLTGGSGADRFEFAATVEAVTVTDFSDAADVLAIDTALWGGALGQARLEALSDVSSGTLVLDFGNGQSITLDGWSDNAGLLDNILLI
ncbi:calcium-binding protein [Mesobacterium pallidum]|uniref:calcium-binding protein n=1 Tax=Mesobacterium pallidum TaxID=2872037 RepID=UPI001EE20628|nr:calcium-binding protein [Mesobacterium pallidum]